MQKCFFVFTFLLTSFLSYSQSGLQEKVIRKFGLYQKARPTEKVYLHSDKSVYGPGEDLWFSTYVTDGSTHRTGSLGTVLYVDLIGPGHEIISQRNIRILNGRGKGDFRLPPSLKPGEYTLRAYTRYMQNFDESFFFYKKIYLTGASPANSLPSAPVQETASLPPSQAENSNSVNQAMAYSLRFFPEGGEMLEGLNNKVAFKATDRNGKPVAVSGEILNQKGEVKTSFNSLKSGMGLFSLIIKPDEEFHASVIINNQPFSFPLPEPVKEGYQLSIRSAGDKIYIQARHNKNEVMENAFVTGQMRGVIFSVIPAKKENNLVYAVLPANKIPAGIAHFTLFDENGFPRAERLVYIDNPQDKAYLKVEPKNNNINPRKPVLFTLSVKDKAGKPLGGSVSVTALDKNLAGALKKENNISTYLLLNSELRGEIENPQYYFDTLNTDRAFMLDLLMLTQGWRKFVWKEVLADSLKPLKHLPEVGFTVEGQLVKVSNNNKGTTGEVTLNFIENPLINLKDTTDDSGFFRFTGLHIPDTATLLLQADKIGSKKESQNSYKNFRLTEAKNPSLPEYLIKKEVKYFPDSLLFRSYAQKQERIKLYDSVYRFSQETIVLNAVETTAKRSNEKDPFHSDGQLYFKPEHRLIIDSLPGALSAMDIYDLIQGRFPGVNVFNSVGEKNIIIGGPNSLSQSLAPLVILDGMPMMDNTILSSLPPRDVAYIDVLKGANATMYGSKGANGVILIYTRRGNGFPAASNMPRTGILDFKHPGYYTAREFYAPAYAKKEPEHVKPDFRSTQYWNPGLSISSEGPARIEFYTSDEKGSFVLFVEGLTSDGRPIYGETMFEVK